MGFSCWLLRVFINIALCTLLILSSPAWAGFLDMPELLEVPELEKKSLLLDLDIPNVRERYKDPSEGPRLTVKAFRVQGFAEFPELGITREALISQVEGLRFDLMKEQEITESGFTDKEIGEIGNLLKDIEENTEDRHVGALELQKLVFLVRQQMRSRGVTIGMLETVADEITQYYRERGFVLARAFVPEQKVRDGIVSITLLVGELGSVDVINNRLYSSGTVKRIFKGDINEPVTAKRISEKIYLLNDLPGFNANGFFEPGKEIGDTRLQISVVNEERFKGNVRYDNHGSEATGEERAYVDFFLNNPLGWRDQWQVGILNSFNPGNTTYGSLRYNSFLLGPRWRVSTGVSNNDFVSTTVIAGAELKSTGESIVADASLGYVFKRSRQRNISANISYTNIDTKLNIADSPQPDNNVRNVRFGFNFDVTNDASRSLHIGSIGLVSSESSEDVLEGFNEEGSAQKYTFLNWDYQLLKIVTLPFTSSSSRIVVDVNGQYSGEHQTSVNQFALTGPNRVKGFDVNRFFSDDGIRVGMEWVFRLPKFKNYDYLGDLLQPYFLLDYAYGEAHPFEEQNLATEEKVTATFSSAGLGFKVNFNDKFRGDLSLSLPIQDDISAQDNSEASSSNLYFSLLYSF